MKNPWIVATLSLALTACSSDGSSTPATGNAATNKTFTYTPGSATSQQASAASLIGSKMVAGSNSATLAVSLGNFSSIASALLGQTVPGSTSVPAFLTGFSSAQASALVAATRSGEENTSSGFDDPNCVQAFPSAVSFTNCTLTESDGSDTVTVTVNGNAAAPDQNHLSYILTFVAAVTGADNGTVTISTDGTIALSATGTSVTVDASLNDGLKISGKFGSATINLDVAENLSLSKLVAESSYTCASYVTGGTIEAKRVWNVRPAGLTANDLPDIGVKATWTRCGEFTVAVGH